MGWWRIGVVRLVTSEERARWARIERKLDALLTHLNIQMPEEDSLTDIRDLAATGRKIEAIKLYRERTGTGLSEAMRAIDEMVC